MDITSEMVEAHPTRCPVQEAQEPMAQAILAAKKDQDSVGGVIRLFVKNTPIGLGEPVFDRVESLLAHAMMSIPATKGFEIGSGFEGSKMRGSEHNDPIYYDGQNFKTKKNDIQNICKLKNSHWKYGIKSQLKWFQMNMKDKDIHNLAYMKRKLVGYVSLRKRSFF